MQVITPSRDTSIAYQVAKKEKPPVSYGGIKAAVSAKARRHLFVGERIEGCLNLSVSTQEMEAVSAKCAALR